MSKYQITEYTLPAPCDLRLAIVADLHNQYGRQAAEAVRATSPDAILIVGDFYETPPRRSYTKYEEAVAFLDGVTGIPVFYSRGNHDYELPSALYDTMTSHGAFVLLDESTTFCGIHIGGLNSAEFEKGKVPNLDFLHAFSSLDGYKLLLCHHPEYYRHIAPLPINLTISGHAHGGQWRFFGKGIFSPGQGLFPKYTSGLYENGRLLVSRGMKVRTPPVPRLFNSPELVLLHLTLEKE